MAYFASIVFERFNKKIMAFFISYIISPHTLAKGNEIY